MNVWIEIETDAYRGGRMVVRILVRGNRPYLSELLSSLGHGGQIPE